ncbi:hypothetical protein E1A91_A03G025200v1 [Gossypium mustelinum]|uniref:Uncharacterized protein n=1 Tax=Gossypium mustelinum TaxID=34275 RepID=A0A5D2ZU52_GOSMU|nr:hypothetical protein E1A91_A03G025200v1 [Gossypium mustelinum]
MSGTCVSTVTCVSCGDFSVEISLKSWGNEWLFCKSKSELCAFKFILWFENTITCSLVSSRTVRNDGVLFLKVCYGNILVGFLLSERCYKYSYPD